MLAYSDLACFLALACLVTCFLSHYVASFRLSTCFTAKISVLASSTRLKNQIHEWDRTAFSIQIHELLVSLLSCFAMRLTLLACFLTANLLRLLSFQLASYCFPCPSIRPTCFPTPLLLLAFLLCYQCLLLRKTERESKSNPLVTELEPSFAICLF